MPPHVLYQIPMVTGFTRWVMLCVASLLVVVIFTWWTPKFSNFLHTLPSRPIRQSAVGAVVVLFPAVFGAVALILLIGLIKNPVTSITETGMVGGTVF